MRQINIYSILFFINKRERQPLRRPLGEQPQAWAGPVLPHAHRAAARRLLGAQRVRQVQGVRHHHKAVLRPAYGIPDTPSELSENE